MEEVVDKMDEEETVEPCVEVLAQVSVLENDGAANAGSALLSILWI